MPNKRTAFWILLFVMVLSGGAFFRLWRLDVRPMHTDEAVHAEKFGTLLEEGSYFYDPHEFHGPTLNYATLISAFLRGEKSYAEIKETTLRLVPAVFGIALILTPLFFLKGLNLRAVFFASLLIAFSPAFVFYSRYYIPEMLLVCFTALFMGALWRFIRSGKLIWVILTGTFLGLMHASKETFVFSIIAAIAAFIVCLAGKTRSFKIKRWHLAAGLCSAITTSVLFYSSFGSNWHGVIDSIATYAVWLQRAGGQTVHIHPWYYYLDLLTWLEFFEPVTWNEDVIVALSVLGVWLVFTRLGIVVKKSGLICFWAFYTLLLAAIYSLIPYKTPWCMLSFLYGMVILAGHVLDWVIDISELLWQKILIGVLFIIFVLAGPIFQSWMLNFRYSSDPTNPYVYAHTGTDILQMVHRVEQAAVASKDGKETSIAIVAAGDDYWPLPWYLRTFPNVGYWNKADGLICNAPIIIANIKLENDILEAVYSTPKPGEKHLYVPLFDEPLFFRPGVQWQGYIRKQLFDEMQRPNRPSVEQNLTIKDSFMQPEANKKEIKNLLKFSHRAMNADFEVFIQHDDGTYAGRAARAAFDEVDRLEQLLSRYIENSDVSRINQLQPGQQEVVSQDTMDCLLVAQKAYELTDGAFDITIGELIKQWKHNQSQPGERIDEKEKAERMELMLDADSLVVQVTNSSISLDLGGVGKGYAVDRIAETLNEWGIDRAFIHGGASSIRALKPPTAKKGWPVTLSNPIDGKTVIRMEMADEVLSCSGLQRDQHIIDPSTGKPVKNRRACWIRLPENAALADALTTAGMIMPIEDVRKMKNHLQGGSIMILQTPDNSQAYWTKIGDWPAE